MRSRLYFHSGFSSEPNILKSNRIFVRLAKGQVMGVIRARAAAAAYVYSFGYTFLSRALKMIVTAAEASVTLRISAQVQAEPARS